VRPHLRAVPEPRALHAAGHRRRLHGRPARRGHPVRDAEVRSGSRGADRHFQHDARACRGSRCGARSRHALRRGRPRRQDDALRLIERQRGIRILREDIPLDDKKTFELLGSGETTGMFQLESAGMRRYIRELKPDRVEDVMAMVALFRPGPMDYIPTYIRRKHGEEPVTYAHPTLEPVLKQTYGVMVYQE